MSHAHTARMRANSRDVLATNATDPTRTKTLRTEYAQRLRGSLARIAAAIRRGIVERDIFGLKGNVQDPAIYRYESDADKQDAFMRWLRTQLDNETLEVISRDENAFIRQAYHRGLDHADSELRKAGVTIPDDQDNPFNLPIHQESVQRLYTRNFEELQGITSEMSRQISRELTAGFTQGHNPRKIARNMADRIDKVGKHRATVMARTEVINAHAEATLDRYERMGVDTVTVRAEIQTAGDNRVCPICKAAAGTTVGVQEMREETFQFEGDLSRDDVTPSMLGQYRRKPPLHPQCRCAILPVVDT